MAVKTRAELKSENAADFPDNTARLISPADLRGQMDDIVDSAVFPEDGIGGVGPPGPAGDVRFVADIAAMRALTGLAPGSIVFVGPQMDQFVVVDEPNLELDGGTAFIPDEYLSVGFAEEVLPWSLFSAPHGGDTGTPENVLYAHPLAHQGIDLDSVQCVVTDAGEIITGWQLHGHCLSKDSREYVRPQAPHIETGPGLFYDWAGLLTALASTRTGGMLLRYRYATNGLRLKRVIRGTEFQIEWWPIQSNASTLADDTNAVCWALNSCARMGASVLHFPAYMIGYSRSIEHPDGLKLKGKGIPLEYDHPGISGLKCMPGAANQAYQLSWSSAPNPAVFPPTNPATRWIAYMGYRGMVYCATISRAANARVTWLEDFEVNGNLLENLQIWTNGSDYALTAINNQLYWRDTPWHSGYNAGNHGGRPVLATGALTYLHNTKFHGFYGFGLNGGDPMTYRSTGRHVVGNIIGNHLHYWVNGVFEIIETFGYNSGDGIRVMDLKVQLLKQRPYRAPSAIHLNSANVPYFNPEGLYRNLFSAAIDNIPNYSNVHSPWPETRIKCLIDYWDCDMSGLDDIPAGEGAELWTSPVMSGDQAKILAGRLRLPRNNYTSTVAFGDSINPVYGPWSTYTIRNLQIEYKSRIPPAFFVNSSLSNGFSNAVFENITIEGLAASDLPETGSAGASLLGQFFFTNPTISGVWGDYYNINFNTVVAASLGGGWIDITPPDVAAPTFRVWFNYNSVSTPPSGTGVTLIPVAVAVGASAATIATAFTAAIRANATALALLTAGPHQQDSRIAVIGSFTLYGSGIGLPTINAFNAPGVILAPRYHRRTYEPNVVQFTSFRATQAVYSYLAVMNPPAPGKQVYFDFKDCVFGAIGMTHIVSTGNVAALTHANWATSRDQIHLNWDNCRIDFRSPEGGAWQNFDPMVYCSTFRNVRARTDTLGTLRSEQSGQFTWIADGVVNFFDIPTQLLYLPKVYWVRPANAAAVAWWRGNDVFVTLVKNAGTALGGTGYYYQTLDTTPQNEDRRAPRLRINLGAVPTAATTFVVRWEAAVSPAGSEGMFQELVGRSRIEEGYDGLSATGDA